jgi:FAD/FMN-containing dehydrogenase
VKNVAGYDLAKMHIGARGAFGEIVEATFKVRPRPAREVAVTFECGSGGEAAAAALEVRDLVEPAWCVVVCEAGKARVVVGVMGSERVVEAHGGAVIERWQGFREDEGAHVRAGLVARLGNPASRVGTASMLAGDVGDYLDSTASRHAGSMVLADVLSGVVTTIDPGDAPRADAPAAAELTGAVGSRLRDALEAAFSVHRVND